MKLLWWWVAWASWAAVACVERVGGVEQCTDVSFNEVNARRKNAVDKMVRGVICADGRVEPSGAVKVTVDLEVEGEDQALPVYYGFVLPEEYVWLKKPQDNAFSLATMVAKNVKGKTCQRSNRPMACGFTRRYPFKRAGLYAENACSESVLRNFVCKREGDDSVHSDMGPAELASGALEFELAPGIVKDVVLPLKLVYGAVFRHGKSDYVSSDPGSKDPYELTIDLLLTTQAPTVAPTFRVTTSFPTASPTETVTAAPTIDQLTEEPQELENVVLLFYAAKYDIKVHNTVEFVEFMEGVLIEALNATTAQVVAVRPGSVIVEALVAAENGTLRDPLALEVNVEKALQEGPYDLGAVFISTPSSVPIPRPSTPPSLDHPTHPSRTTLQALIVSGALAALLLGISFVGLIRKGKKRRLLSRAKAARSLDDDDPDQETLDTPTESGSRQSSLSNWDPAKPGPVLPALEVALIVLESHASKKKSVMVNPVRESVDRIIEASWQVLSNSRRARFDDNLLGRLETHVVEVTESLGLIPFSGDERVSEKEEEPMVCDKERHSIVLDRTEYVMDVVHEEDEEQEAAEEATSTLNVAKGSDDKFDECKLNCAEIGENKYAHVVEGEGKGEGKENDTDDETEDEEEEPIFTRRRRASASVDIVLRDIVLSRMAHKLALKHILATEAVLGKLGHPLAFESAEDVQVELDESFSACFSDLIRENGLETMYEDHIFHHNNPLSATVAPLVRKQSLKDLNQIMCSTLDLLSKAVLQESPRGESHIPFEELTFSKQLGVGSFGTIHKGLRGSSQPVAIRSFREGTLSILSVSVMATFVAEFERWKQLQHPKILSVYGYCIDPKLDRLCFVTELCDISLASRLHYDMRTVQVDEFLRIAVDIASALVYAHRHGIVHRDLKPSNVLLNIGPDGEALEAKIGDFGIRSASAELDAGAESEQVSCGTPTFLPPELMLASPLVSYKADIYSLGVVMWEITEHQEAWEKESNAFVLADNVKRGLRPLFSSRSALFPQSILSLIEECWQPRRYGRPSSGQVHSRLVHLQQSRAAGAELQEDPSDSVPDTVTIEDIRAVA